ncbi:hypothetical protein GTY41_36375, partial [Streptomyces sp. SID685]|uniref:hypothetical protein n=1 Tax=Streptomyces sp. SID685 TaxID=2690322 RepID=UPI0013712A6E
MFLVWFARCSRIAVLLSPGVVRGSAAWGPVVGLRAHRPLVQDVLRASTPGNECGAPGSQALTAAAG